MPLNFALFHNPRYGGFEITHSWLTKAENAFNSGSSNFEQFLFLYMAFNSWGMCVTLSDTDAQMIERLQEDPRVRAVFDCLVKQDADLRVRIQQIENNFPLPSFSDLLAVDTQYDWRGERNIEFWKKIATAEGKKKVRMSPSLKIANLNWKDTLACLYKVRCNLVHGGKAATHGEDMFVGVFVAILRKLFLAPQGGLLSLF